MFRLWGSGLGIDKAASEKAKLAGMKPPRSSVIKDPLANHMKRKRSDSQESASPQFEPGPLTTGSDQTRWIAGDPISTQSSVEESSVIDSREDVAIGEARNSRVVQADPAATIVPASAGMRVGTCPWSYECQLIQLLLLDPTELTPLQQQIEAQFSLEILMKHNELRLIDQELAKCQIALEQLRRCQIIPFPASSLEAEKMQQVSDGKGPSVKVGEETQPRYSAPWGVADGPYTRHYAKWLIPDEVFDGRSNAQDALEGSSAGRTVTEGRATRGSFTETSSVAGKSRSQRGSAGSKLQALSSGYPPPKDKAGPLILKRSTDGQLVKLVCLDCRRDNFSSAQGFINHCRIAHNRGFASHDAAAIACGEEIVTDESGGMIIDSEYGSGAVVGFVHPLIRSAHLTQSTQSTLPKTPVAHASVMDQDVQKPNALLEPRKGFSKPPVAGHETPTNVRTSAPIRPIAGKYIKENSAFVPSPQTPHLSALMQMKGRSGDLPELISQAKTKLDLDLDLPDEEESDQEAEVQYRTNAERHRPFGSFAGSRLPVRATMSPVPLDRPGSSKGFDKGSRKPSYLNGIVPRSTYASPYASKPPTTEPDKPEGSDPMAIDASTPFNLSPNTVESNQAPSLVSDDGDYEAHSESESLSSAEPDDEDGYPGITVEHEGEGSGATAADPELTNSTKAHPTRRPSALKGTASRDGGDQRHVTFVSPSKPRGRRRAGPREGSK